MKYCKVCRKKPRLERRVNNEGVVFCSDDCYEEFENSPNDYDHPYIDDYDAIRREYISWMRNYEEKLYKGWYYGFPRKEHLQNQIDEMLWDYWDYYRLEGMDGLFSSEIYDYLMEFEELKLTIQSWGMNGKELEKWKKWWKEEWKRKQEEEED